MPKYIINKIILIGVLSLVVGSAVVSAATSSFTTSLTTTGGISIGLSTPTNLTATAMSPAQINLSWTASVGDLYPVAGYRVFRDSIFIATTTDTIYIDSGLSPSTTYTYTVQAFDTSMAVSSSSLPASATTLAVPIYIPAAPGSGSSGSSLPLLNIYNTNITPGINAAKITFDTTVPTRSKIFWGKTTEYEMGSLSSLFYNSSHEYSVTGLSPNTQYFLRVQVTDIFGRAIYVNYVFTTTGTHVVGALPNPSNFEAVGYTDHIGLTWTNTTDARLTGVRIIRSENFYPKDQNDGTPIFEGSATNHDDTNVVIGQKYYYAIFSMGKDGIFSSGALALAEISGPGGGITKRLGKPIASIEKSSLIDPMIDALTLADFQFIQDEKVLSQFNSSVTVDAGKDLTVRLDYVRVPEILKNIVLAIADPSDPTKVFTFLLRVNKDKSAFEATIGPLERPDRFALDIAVLDFQNKGLKKLNGDIVANVYASLGRYGGGVDFLAFVFMFLLAIILFLLVLVWRKREDRKKKHVKSKVDHTHPKSKFKNNRRNQDRSLPSIVRNKTSLFTLVLVFSVVQLFNLSVHQAFADFNKQINYQGKLATGSNSAVADGKYNIRFKLYTTSSGGSPIWTETWCNTSSCNGLGTGGDSRINITSGLFSTMLGSTTPLTNVNFNQPLYLSIEVGGTAASMVPLDWDGEMTPRKIIGAVPAAFIAATSTYAVTAGTSTVAISANTLSGIASTSFFRNDIQNATSSAATFLNILQSGVGKIAEFFTSAANSALAILSNGNIGVGSSTPSSKFAIHDSSGLSGTNPIFTIASSTSAGMGTTTLLTVLGNGNISSSGNVSMLGTLTVSGTATSTIATGLDVNGNVIIGNSLSFNHLTGTPTIKTDSADAKIEFITDRSSTSAVSFNFRDMADNSALAILDGGNVGIGTTAPGSKLEVVSSSGISWNANALSYGAVTIGSNVSQASTSGGSLFVRTTQFADSYQKGLGVYGTAETSSTNDGIVNLTAYGTKFNGYGSAMAFSTTNGTAVNEAMRINRSGNVGIGTTTPATKLDINGSVAVENGGMQIGGVGQLPGIGHLTLGAAGNMGDYGTLNVGMTGNTYTALTIGDQTTPASAAGIYLRSNGTTPAGISTAGSPLSFFMSGPGTSEAMRITATGYVGIGTTTPGAKLTVSDSSAPIFLLEKSGANAKNWYLSNSYFGFGAKKFAISDDNGARLLIDDIGNVGIGTTAPHAKLDVTVNASGDAIRIGRVDSVGDNHGILLGYNSPTTASYNKVGIFYKMTGAQGQGELHFVSENTASETTASITNSVMMVNSAGNVGIGTTSPASTLHVAGKNSTSLGNGDLPVIISSTGDNTYSGFDINNPSNPNQFFALAIAGNATTDVRFGLSTANGAFLFANHGGGAMPVSKLAIGLTTDAPIYFANNNTVRLTIASTTGNVGVGTTNPLNKFNVYDTQAGTAAAVLPVARFTNSTVNGSTKVVLGTDNTTADAFSVFTAGSTAQTQILGFGVGNAGSTVAQMVLNGNGNVGIGTTNPTTRLQSTIGAGGVTILTGINDSLRLQANGNGFNDGGSNNIVFGQDNSGLDLGRFGLRWNIGATQMNFVWGSLYNGGANTVDKMILTGAGNLGIGSSTPGSRLVAKGSGNTSSTSGLNVTGSDDVSHLFVRDDGSVGIGTTAPTSNLMVQGTSGQSGSMFNIASSTGATAFNVDSAGRIGVGVTPSAWTLAGGAASSKTIDLNTGGAFYGTANGISMVSNMYFDGTNWKYKTSDAASLLATYGGSYLFYTVPSGTAGANASLTERMHLSSTGGLSLGSGYVGNDAGAGNLIVQGNIGIGTTNPTGKLEVVYANDYTKAPFISTNTSGAPTQLFLGYSRSSGHAAGLLFNDNADGVSSVVGLQVYGDSDPVGLYVKKGGNVGIGTTAPGVKLQIESSATQSLKITSGEYYTSLGIDPAISGTGGILQGDYGLNFKVNRSAAGQTYDGSMKFETAGVGSFKFINGSVGIGTTAPTQRLHVSSGVMGAPVTSGIIQTYGTMRLRGNDNGILDQGFLAGGAGAWFQSTDQLALGTNYPLLLNPNGGNIGIGTTSPNFKLDVLVPHTGGMNVAGATTNLDAHYLLMNKNALSYYGGYSTTNLNVGTGFSSVSIGNFNISQSVNLLTTGSVGIGSSTPGSRLVVKGSGNTSATSALNVTGLDDSSHLFVRDDGSVGIGTTGPGSTSKLTIAAADNTDATLAIINIAGNTRFAVKPLSNGGFQLQDGGWSGGTGWTTTGLTQVAGFVGIGTTTPAARLAVQDSATTGDVLTIANASAGGGSYVGLKMSIAGGSLAYGALRSYIDSAGLSHTSILTGDNAGNALSEKLSVNSLGSVGIGTTAPGAKLDVYTNASAASGITLAKLRWDITGTANERGDFDFTNAAGTGVSARISNISEDGTHSSMGLWTYNGSAITQQVTIKSSGNVGIGTTAPRSALDTGTGVMSGAANDYIKAQFTMSGGGTVTWVGPTGKLKWTARFIAIPVSRTTVSSGYVDMVQPTTSIPAVQVYNGVARTADANGVILNAWEALWAVHTPGGAYTDIAYYITVYSTSFNAPSNWILVAAVNGDDNSIKLGTGIILKAGGSYNAGVDGQYVALQTATPGTQQTGHMNVSGTGLFGGSVGIGTTAPGAKLDVHQAYAGSPLYEGPVIRLSTDNGGSSWATGEISGYVAAGVNNSTGGFPGGLSFKTKPADSLPGTAPTTKMVIDAAGNVGVGTTNPGTMLDVAGGATIRGTANHLPVLTLGTPGAINAIVNTADEMYLNIDSDNNQTGAGFHFGTNRTIDSGGTELVTFLDSGSVGIGTTAPVSLGAGGVNTILQVHKTGGFGLLQLSSDITAAGVVGSMEFGSTGLSNSDKRIAIIYGTKTDAGTAGGTGDLVFGTFNSGTYGERMRILSGGSVGIGTTNPVGNLTVAGTLASPTAFQNGDFGQIYVNGKSASPNEYAKIGFGNPYASGTTGATAAIGAQFRSNGTYLSFGTSNSYPGLTNTAMTIDPNGYVGIGISNPGAKFEVNGGGVDVVQRLFSGSATKYAYLTLGGTAENLEFGMAGAAGQFFSDASQGSGILKQVNTGGNLMLGVGSGNSSMTLINGGNVGIGTTNPAQKLDVRGSTIIGGTNDLLKVSGAGAGNGISLESLDGTASSYRAFTMYGTSYSFTNSGTPLVTFQAAGNVGIGVTNPSSFKLQVAGSVGPNADATYDLGSAALQWRNAYVSGSVIQGGYLNPNGDNMLYNGDFELGTVGWNGGAVITTDQYSGGKSLQVTGGLTLQSTDFIPVDPTRDVIQLEMYAKKTVAGTTPGVLYLGYFAYDKNKAVITSAPCGTYCYFAAAGYVLPVDGAWHKFTATRTGEGTSNPNFPVGTKFIQVLGLVNYSSSADAVTLIDHVSVRNINTGPVFVGNNFSGTNMSDQFQTTKLYTDSTKNFFVEPPTNGDVILNISGTGNVGIGTTNPTSVLDIGGYVASDATLVGIRGPKTFSGGIPLGQLNVQDSTSMASGVGGAISFSGSYAGTVPTTFGSIEGVKSNGTNLNYDGDLVFKTRVNGGSNTEKMRILANGSVGIGTTAPTHRLDVVNTTLDNTAFLSMLEVRGNTNTESANGAFDVTKPSIGISFSRDWASVGTPKQLAGIYAWGSYNWGGGLAFTTTPGTANGIQSTRMVITDGGSVGIGTTNPQGNLHVYGDNLASSIIDGNTGAIQQQWNRLGVMKGIIGIAGSTGSINAGTVLNDLAFRSVGKMVFSADNGATGQMTLLTNGNFGIGTTAPDSKFQIGSPVQSNYVGSVPVARILGSPMSGSSETLLRLDRTTRVGNQYGGGVDFNVYSYDTSSLAPKTQMDIALKSSTDYTETGTVNVMTLRDNGNVGIGTTNPVARLEVNGGDLHINNATTPALRFLASGVEKWALLGNYGTTDALSFYKYGSGAGIKVIFDSAGNVGIGTTAPIAKLDVAGSINIQPTENPFSAGLYATTYETSILVPPNTTGTNVTINGRFNGLVELNITWTGDTGDSIANAVITAVASMGSTAQQLLSDINLIEFKNLAGTYWPWTTAPGVAIYAPNNGTAPSIVVVGKKGSSSGTIFVKMKYTGAQRDVTPVTLSLPGGAALSTTWLTSPLLQTYYGNVGIGTSAPYDRLDVTSSLSGGTSRMVITNSAADAQNNASEIGFKNSSSFNAGYYTARITSVIPAASGNLSDLAFSTYDGATAAGTEKMRITSAGKIGIGTTAPNTQVEIYKSLATNTTLQSMLTLNSDYGSAAGTGFGSAIVFRGRTAGNMMQDNAKIAGYNPDASDNGYSLGFFTAPSIGVMTERLSITRAGYVGINTTNPGQIFEIVGATGSPATSGTTDNGMFRMRGSSGGNGMDMGVISAWPYTTWLQSGFVGGTFGTNYPLALNPNGGNVGIGTINPGGRFEISVPTDGNIKFGNMNAGYMQIMHDTGSTYFDINQQVASGDLRLYATRNIQFRTSSVDPAVTFSQSGNVGIGTTAPKDALDIRGNYVRGDKTITISSTWTPVLSINFPSDHTSAYAKIFYGGNDWCGHSGVRFEAEFDAIDGGGGYSEPGRVIRQSSNTAGDQIQARLTHINPNTVNIELRTYDIEGNGWNCSGIDSTSQKLIYEVSGTFTSIGLTTGTVTTTSSDNGMVLYQGNLGIGATNPMVKLDVNGNTFVRGTGTYFNNAGAAELQVGYGMAAPTTAGSVTRLALQPYAHTGGPWNFISRDVAGTAYLDIKYGTGSGLTLDSSGNVGIGATNPATKLDVRSGYLVVSDNASGESNAFVQGSTGIAYFGSTGSNRVSLGNTTNYEMMTVTGNNVGVGTTNPTQKLDVVGNIELGAAVGTVRYIMTDEVNTGTGMIVMQAGAGSAGYGGAINLFAQAHATNPGSVRMGIGSGAGTVGTATEGRFSVNSQALGGGTDLFTVLRTGNVGIGATLPNRRLVIQGSNIANDQLLYLKQNNEYGYSFNIDSLNTGRMMIKGVNNGVESNIMSLDRSNGNVGIGTTGPTAKFDVVGAISLSGSIHGQGNSDAKLFYNLGTYSSDGATGVVVIQTPVPQDDHTMTTTKILVHSVYSDGTKNNCELTVSGYWSSEANGGFSGNGMTKVCGNTMRVRFMRQTSTGNVAIILGDTTTSWSYPKVSVTEWLAGYGIADSYADGWTITTTADLSGYMNSDEVPDTTAIPAANITAGTFQNAAFTFQNNVFFPGSGIWNTAGNVGIGTTAPGYKLDVNGNVKVGTNLYLYNTVLNPASGYSNQIGAGFNSAAGTFEIASNNNIPLTIGRFGGTGSLLNFRYAGTTMGDLNTDGTNLSLQAAGNLSLQPTAGSVGIGTTNPQNRLHVETATINTFPLRISGDTDVAGQWSGIQFGLNGYPSNYAKAAIMIRGTTGSVQPEMHFLVDGAADTGNADISDAKLSILPTGYVGIGTTNPGALFNVNGRLMAGGVASDIGNPTHVLMSTGGTAIQYAGSSGNYLLINPGDANTTLSLKADARTGAYPPMDFWTSNLSRLIILANGYVGIGTTNPTTLFQLNGASAQQIFNIDPTFANGVSLNSTGHIRLNSLSGYGAEIKTTTGDIILTQNSVTPFTSVGTGAVANTLYLKQGNVGIGTTGPSGSLDVRNDGSKDNIDWGSASSVFGHINYSGSVAQIYSSGGYDLALGSNSVSQLYLKSGGNVGIGTTAPSGRMQVGSATFNGSYGSYDPSRNGLLLGEGAGSGGMVSLQISSTYNGTSNPNYGIVLVNGPTTSSYDAWAIMHDGPARAAGGLQFAYSAQGTNMHGVTPMVTFQKSGNVGIGTTTPTYSKLQVYDAGNTYSGFFQGNALGAVGLGGSTSGGYIQGFTKDAVPTNLLLQISSGNVGIGTTAPGAKLHIAGTAVSSGSVVIKNQKLLTLELPTGAEYQQGAELWLGRWEEAGNAARTALTFSLQHSSNFLPADVDVMTMLSNGNVGIGTTAPRAKLDISSLGPDPTVSSSAFNGKLAIGRGDNSDVGILEVGTAGGSYAWLQYRNYGTLSTYYPLSLNPLGGNVGIGTTNPGTKLEVDNPGFNRLLVKTTGSTGGTDAQVTVDSTANHSSAKWSIGTGSSGTGSLDDFYLWKEAGTTGAKLVVNNAGNVGIGTVLPGNKFTVNDTKVNPSANVSADVESYLTSTVNVTTPSIAMQSQVQYTGTNALTASYTGSSYAYGSLFGYYGGTNASGAGTVDTAVGIATQNLIRNGMTVTNAMGIQIQPALSDVGAGTATNVFGVYIKSPVATSVGTMYGIYLPQYTIGSTDNYAIYTAGTTKSFFGGKIGIGVTNPAGQLALKNQISSALLTYAATSGTEGQSILNSYYTAAANGDPGPYPRFLDIASVGAPDGTNGGGAIRFLTNPIAVSSPAVERMRIASNGNVGIGASAPVSYLDVSGVAVLGGGTVQTARLTSTGNTAFTINAGSTANYAYQTFAQGGVAKFEMGYSATSDGAGTVMYFNPNVQSGAAGSTMVMKAGNVGIGTTAPGNKLSVAGTILSTGAVTAGAYQYGVSSDGTFSGTTQSNVLYAGGTIAASTAVTERAGLRIDNSALGSGASITTNYGLFVATQSTGSTNYAVYSQGGTNYFGGNVGVGIANPQTKLQVSLPTGTYASFGNTGYASTDWYGIHVGYTEAGNTNYRKTMIAYEGLGDGAARGNLHLLVNTTSSAASATLADSRLMISGLTGNVGIGTTIPGYKLDVAGTIHTTGDIVADANYGLGLVGLYSSTAYQNVFAMGAAYRLPASGITPGNLYGIAWTHTNVGGESKAGLEHQALFMANGITKTAIGTGIWTSGVITGTSNLVISGTVTGGTYNGQTISSAANFTGTVNVAGNLTAAGGTFTTTVPDFGPASNNPEVGRWNPLWTAISAGQSVYDDEEFSVGTNGVNVYNNSGGTGVIITRISDSTAPNTSKYSLQIVNNGLETSPGYGGFYQAISSRANTTFVQRFRAKLPVGFFLQLAENAQGSNNTSYWLTPTAGTGKWEEYIRVSHAGNTGTFSSGGHVFVTGPVAVFTWYLASSNVYEVEQPAMNQIEMGTAGYVPSYTTTGSRNLRSASSLYITPGGGNVGIGTTNPRTNLEISGSQTNSPVLGTAHGAFSFVSADKAYGLYGNVSGAGWVSLQSMRNDSATAFALNLNPVGGNVGIGTTGPNAKLHIKDIAATSALLILDRSGASSLGIDFNDSGDGFTGPMASIRTAPSGLGSDSSGYLAFFTNQNSQTASTISERMRIDKLGNVGIGTTAPGAKLHIDSTESTDTYTSLRLAHSGWTGTYFDVIQTVFTGEPSLQIKSNSDSSSGIVYRDTGNVGIGTTTPDAPLNISKLGVGSNSDVLLTVQTTNDQTPRIRFRSNGVNRYEMFGDSDHFGIDTPGNYGATGIVLKSGNVGIGTTGPQSKLHIFSAGNQLKLEDSRGTANAFTTISSSYDSTHPFSLLVANNDPTGKEMLGVYSTAGGGDERVAFMNGNVGIGTTGPAWLLEVNKNSSGGSTGQYPAVSVNNPNAAGYGGFYLYNGTTQLGGMEANTATGNISLYSQTSKSLLLNPSGGNVGIGTTTPLQKLHVAGHCMTGDTLLPIRRRKKKSKNAHGEDDGTEPVDGDEYDYQFVAIRDIQPGDEVMTLEEATNKVVYQKINALMDMGIREIFEVRTKSGRVIKTTSTHPYLARMKEITNTKAATSQKSESKNTTSRITNSDDNDQISGSREILTPGGRDIRNSLSNSHSEIIPNSSTVSPQISRIDSDDMGDDNRNVIS
ncbi:MAG: hypothetical protein WCG02_00660 [Candidatus Taylorbacteria bacterium]